MYYGSRFKLRVMARGFLISQGIGFAIALILFLYGQVSSFPNVLFISLLYTNLSWPFVQIFGFLFRLNWSENKSMTRSFTLKSIAAFSLGLIVSFELATLIIRGWFIRDFMPFVPFFSLWHLYVILMNLGAAILVVLLVGLYKNLKYKLERRNREYMELENLQVKTRLAALQAKLNPHFLFNTLNVILDLAAQSPEKIEPVVLNLSDIYRKILSLTDNEWSTVGDEIELVRKYLEIEKLRLENRLSYRLDWDETLASIALPPLLIEPLVENAVIHGISAKKEGGEILVRIGKKEDILEIDIEDNGLGMKDDDPGKGFGLFSVRERMALIYGAKARMTISQAPGGGTRVRLEVPLAP